jgi:F-type H+-transporting ATPase subunit epsilon
MAQLQCIVVTPESTVLDEPVDFVALPLDDGEIGIAPLHSPMIGRLGYGELRLMVAGQPRRYYVDGGFVQVVGNVVSVLTNRAVPSTALDSKVAAEHLAQARAREAHGDELLTLRDRQERQARAQLRLAERAR